jgi:ribosome-binding protein aMBF1 (putative translation factor)
VITGAQIRAGRELLGWTRFQLGQRASLHEAIVARAESATGAVPITPFQHVLLRNALETAGVEFTNGDEPGVKLKARGKTA